MTDRARLVRRTWRELQKSDKHFDELVKNGSVNFFYKINLPDEPPLPFAPAEPIPVLTFKFVKNKGPNYALRGWVICENVFLQAVMA